VEQQLIPYTRVRELFAELVGAPVSLGTLSRWVQQGARTLQPVEAAIKVALQRAPVRHSDETGVRRSGTLAWAHVASTARPTHEHSFTICCSSGLQILSRQGHFRERLRIESSIDSQQTLTELGIVDRAR
jgi:hypothetical protein